MWFDVAAALAEIEAHRPATPATHDPSVRAVSQESRVSQHPKTETSSRVAEVASVATLFAPSPSGPKPHEESEPDIFRNGRSVTGNPRTWTGRVVSLA